MATSGRSMPVAALTAIEAVSCTPEHTSGSFQCTKCCKGMPAKISLSVSLDATQISLLTGCFNSPRRRSLGLAELYAKAISAQKTVLLAAVISPLFPMVIYDTLWSYCQIPRLVQSRDITVLGDDPVMVS